MISRFQTSNSRTIPTMNRKILLALASIVGTFVLHAGSVSGQTISVHPGTSGCTGSAALTIPEAGGTASFHVCVNSASPATLTCGAGYRLTASASNGSTITARTLGASYPDPLQSNTTFLNGTNNALAPSTSNAGAVVGDGVTPIAAANGILAAAFTLTVPGSAPAGTFTVGPTAPLINITINTCDGTGASDRTPAAVTPLNVIKAAPAVATAPTVAFGASPTLTGGSGSQAVNVVTPGSLGGSLALSCSIGAPTNAAAAIAISSGATQTIAAGATTATPIGLTCTPQAATATATLTCTQTATPGPNPANLTSTITCPAAAAASITYTATPAVLTFAGVTAGTPTATQSVTVAANAANTAALNVASCAFGGANAAEFSFSPAQTFPQSVAAGASAALPVRFTPAAADSAARSATLTCQTPNATAAGATSFVVTLNGTNPAPVPIVIAATTPAGNVVLPALTIGATPAFVTTALNFNVTGGAGTLTCVVTGAGYTATGSPLSLVVGTTRTLTVTYTGATAGTFTGTLTCTSTAPATGGPFVYNLSTTVQAAPAIGPTVQVPTIGAFGLGLLGLLIAGFAGWVQRRQVK